MSEKAANKTKLRAKYWVGANILGIGIYLYFASRLWPLPKDAGTDLAANPIVWGLTAFPAFAVCSLINIIWLTLILHEGFRGKGWRSMRAWLLVVVSWAAVNRFDNYNIEHGSTFRIGNVPSPSVSNHSDK